MGQTSGCGSAYGFEPPAAHAFEFKEGSGTLEEQAGRFCANWIRDADPNNLAALLRKPSMVTSFQAYFQSFHNFHRAPIPTTTNGRLLIPPVPSLRCIQERMLMECVTALLNGMVEAYDQYPLSSMEGEANAWTGNSCVESTSNAAFELQSNKRRKRPLLESYDGPETVRVFLPLQFPRLWQTTCGWPTAIAPFLLTLLVWFEVRLLLASNKLVARFQGRTKTTERWI